MPDNYVEAVMDSVQIPKNAHQRCIDTLTYSIKGIRKHTDEFYYLTANNLGEEVTKEHKDMAAWHGHEINKYVGSLSTVLSRLKGELP